MTGWAERIAQGARPVGPEGAPGVMRRVPPDPRPRQAILDAADLAVIPSEQQLMRTLDRIVERRRMFENLLLLFSADDECPHGNVRGTEPPRCDCFKPEPAAEREPERELVAAAPVQQMQALVCLHCGSEWEREPRPGRKPRACPDCKPNPSPGEH